MKKSIHEHWQIFQPNPTEPKYKSTKGDCAIRAICAALDIDWRTAFDMMCAEARERYTMPNETEIADLILERNGFERVAVKREKGKKAPTPNTLCEQYPEATIFCRLSGHFVTCKNGKYLDTWQSGSKTCYYYYIKQ